MIHFQANSLSFLIVVNHLAIARENTCIDHMIELAAIACCHEEISRQFQTYKQWQILAVAVELKVRIQLCNCNPGQQICERKEVARLMNPHQLAVFLASRLQAKVQQFHCRIVLDCINNQLQVASPSKEWPIVLCFTGSSKAAKLRLGAINNVALAVVINSSKGQTEQCTWAGLACRQAENQSALAQLGVTVREGEKVRHRFGVVNLR